ncbi:MAG: VWA domain-containing protein [Myxococcota bacterium]
MTALPPRGLTCILAATGCVALATLAGCGAAGRAFDQPAYIAQAPPSDEPVVHNTESYDRIRENPFVAVADDPRSTFSIDVDTASYSNVRRFLEQGQLPPPDAVRLEELINYFSYSYPEPEGDTPFSVTSEVGPCPWNSDHRLVHIGLRGRAIEAGRLPPRNLTFLLDVSGSMGNPNKLPLLKSGLGLLVEQLTERDRVSIVVYAGAAGRILEPTPGSHKDRILAALNSLRAGGSTAGGAGIKLAYATARENFVPGGINRVILATDGDFNVGVSSRGALERLIEKEREGGVFLTVLGLGTGNLKDSQMEALADKGNGNYAYIDTIHEARKVLVEEAGSTLVTIAKDVKLQVEFNPTQVEAFRLIGYENRVMHHRDFADDTKDAGEIGAGHTVTALYEVVPAGSGEVSAKVAPLKYQDAKTPPSSTSNELLTFKVRYKQPTGHAPSRELTFPVQNSGPVDMAQASEDYRFSAAVAGFGMLLRDSKHSGQLTWSQVVDMALEARGQDRGGYRSGFVQLAKTAAALSGQGPRADR